MHTELETMLSGIEKKKGKRFKKYWEMWLFQITWSRKDTLVSCHLSDQKEIRVYSMCLPVGRAFQVEGTIVLSGRTS